MSPRENGSGEEPVIRDNRKIDPETGRAREATTADDGVAQEESSSVAQEPEAVTADGSAADLLAERTADLQRLQAEFSNYRKRVERDRITVKEQAVASVLTELLPVLDDIGRARDHGELTGGFAKVSESLEAAVGKLGLATYGTKGDPFDPTVHEALLHSYSAEVTEPTCVEILQPGYRINDRILRPARVAVAEPSEEEAPRDAADDSGAADGSDEN
ncbi:nucleotide exchange factor GrpE [Microbispora triticiradicis]|uniref:Protein GrpE n=2 Tax=Microbispora TaxID=2005 RepID=A0ABY3M5Q8_9ACTN|nr:MULTISPECIES: nucleotide exchange factor GrpE [Microbispora]TLP66245.1 nucleotide exchange factor GrpE [Microbispora fusca]TYB68029.1 nucleotide exchange factor GrpE [Microbispora tritici]